MSWVMTKIKKIFRCVLILLLTPAFLTAQFRAKTEKYHTPDEVQQALNTLHQKHQADTQIHYIAESPGGNPVTVLEIGSNQSGVPAIFVGANFEGNIPLSTEGAVRLAQMLIDSAHYTSGLKWYVLPLPNPDAASGYFSEVKYGRTVNDFEVNNDADEAINEDGFDDLNNDGFITQMRVKSFDGTHVVSKSDPRIMVPANVEKGERGAYKIYTEGIDNDGDGQFNEDGEGGINPGISFPHLFPENNKEAGIFPGQAPEVYGIMKFIFDHPEIAMVYTLGSSDFCRVPPQGGRKGEVNLERINLSRRYARMLNADESQTFTIDELVDLVKKAVPAGTDVTPAMVAGMLGLGPVVNPLEEDLVFYQKLADDYKNYLKARNFSTENLAPKPAKDGSFELWAYYHLGIPSFSMHLFSVPKIEDGPTEDTDDNEADKEKEKTKKEKQPDENSRALLAWSDREWAGKGFVDWQKFQHPDLGEVEIGGFIPYLESTPKAEHIDSLLQIQLPWLLQLTKNLPEIFISGEKITDLGSGVYKLELFIENNGYFSWPIAMGQRNRQPAPVVIVLDENIDLLEGTRRTPLGSIGGNQVRKLTWLIKANRKAEISAHIESAVFGKKVKQIKIGG
jgi:hypothetical protein